MFRWSPLWERDRDRLIVAPIGGFRGGFPNPVLTAGFKGSLSFARIQHERRQVCGHSFLLFLSLADDFILLVHAPFARSRWYLRASHHPPRSLLPRQTMRHQTRETVPLWPLPQDGPDASSAND